jgi:hypothetical protein
MSYSETVLASLHSYPVAAAPGAPEEAPAAAPAQPPALPKRAGISLLPFVPAPSKPAQAGPSEATGFCLGALASPKDPYLDPILRPSRGMASVCDL